MVDSEKTSIPERINKAAAMLIFSSGVKGWNMDDCAREAGITKRTLYQYIESREKLIEQVLCKFISATQKQLIQELSGCPDFKTGMDKMLQIFPEMIVKMESRIVQDIFRIYPDIESHVIQTRLTLAEETLKYIRKAQQDGAVKKDVDAETILEMIQSFILYYSKNNPSDFKVKLRNAIASCLFGILETD
ncbi:MAG: TetR/AcrR family transcriptional regulator [Spirochaetales bacterium]|nr:TetR/AcrR family transcriptional regulator [Spirochaetales bacterium]